MNKFYQNINQILLRKNPILISNVDQVNQDEYVIELYIKKDKNFVYFTFQRYLEVYGEATDLYEIYDHCEFENMSQLFSYFDERYAQYQNILNEILNFDYKRFLK